MYETLKAILVDELQLSEEDVRPDAQRDEAGLDSLSVVELSLILTKRFNIEISDDELLEAATVADIVRLVESRTHDA